MKAFQDGNSRKVSKIKHMYCWVFANLNKQTGYNWMATTPQIHDQKHLIKVDVQQNSSETPTAQLAERRVSGRKIAEFWFDSRTGNASLWWPGQKRCSTLVWLDKCRMSGSCFIRIKKSIIMFQNNQTLSQICSTINHVFAAVIQPLRKSYKYIASILVMDRRILKNDA